MSVRQRTQIEINKMRESLGQVIFSARQNKGWTQEKLSQKSGIPQGSISKYENGQTAPEASVYLIICRTLEIEHDTIMFGFIDSLTNASNKLKKNRNNPRIPNKYKDHPYFNIRDINFLLTYYLDKYGEDKKRKLLEKLKVPDYYFMSLDNQLGLNFLIDLKNEVTKEESSFLDSLSSEKFCSYQVHGRLHDLYHQSESGIEAIKKFIKNIKKYNYCYEIEILNSSPDSISFILMVMPQLRDNLNENHLHYLKWDLSILKSLFLKNMTNYGNKEKETEYSISFKKESLLVYTVSVRAIASFHKYEN